MATESKALQGCVGSAVIPGTEGGSIIIDRAGARVLRLVGQSGYDFFWLHDSLMNGASVEPTAFGWKNLGGDRTWIAPEPDFFWTDSSDIAGTYHIPEAIDPGGYDMEAGEGGARLWTEMELENFHLGGSDRLSLEKRIIPALNPFTYSRIDEACRAAEYVGYQQVSVLSLLSEVQQGHRFGMWQITQVSAPGEILVPTTAPDPPTNYIDPTGGAECVTLSPGLVRFRVDGKSKQKIGVKADSLLGRIAYLRQCEDGLYALVVRNFQVNPSGCYIDAPWTDADDLGYAVQCYGDDGGLAEFGEFEYHAPAIGDGTGVTSCTDCSQVWAFRAGETVIAQIAQRLLGVRI